MNGQVFPDPSIIRTKRGWHIFATNAHIDGKHVSVQVGFSKDFEHWAYRNGYDALPELPEWVSPVVPLVWAPDVNALPGGRFVL